MLLSPRTSDILTIHRAPAGLQYKQTMADIFAFATEEHTFSFFKENQIRQNPSLKNKQINRQQQIYLSMSAKIKILPLVNTTECMSCSLKHSYSYK